MEFQEKEEEKDDKGVGKLYRKHLKKKGVIKTRLKAIQIIGQRKALCKQRIPVSSIARKETVDINILITSRNDDRKNMQSFRTTSGPATKMRK